MRQLLLVLCCMASSFNATFAQTFSQHEETPYVTGDILIQLNKGYTVDQLIKALPGAELKVVKEISHHMRFWHLTFDHNVISHPEMIRQLRASKMVRSAQNNHFIQERATVPNDPNFTNQWHHKNTGGGGGTADADIDSDEAWDITTGGVTAQGDTIVVALVEGPGAYYNHPDLRSNFWRNYQEIDGNGIDDDGNGYIDDFNGWNVGSSNDNHSPGGHGTQCMGMIAARGNNSVGVAGINWRTKVMLVSGFGISESSVMNAYDYPLTMRKLYNQTGGTKGAYVVSTSSSWGIDGADADDYPLWCAFYDTLGVHGILSVGATTNSTVNVDMVGDMPTGCSSDYMISVTRTGNTDNQAGGYGLTTIDFGAPGINVYTTSGTSSGSAGYSSTTGTSFSCPLTAGAIALLYSVPCTSFINMAKADPQGGADYIRQLLMNNVDLVSSMSGKSVTGGRLNIYKSANALLTGCSTSSCPQPFGLTVSGINNAGATLNWTAGGSSAGYYYYYRPTGATDWDSVFVSTNSATISGLDACTPYEVMVAAWCTTELSDYSGVSTFTTTGCCTTPTGLTATPITFTSASINFTAVPAASSYNVRYKETSASTWNVVNITTVPYTLVGLDSCTNYEVQVQTVCSSTTTAFSASANFNTAGCGFCEDTPYCASSGGSVDDEYLAKVQLEDINRTSGPDDGYIFTGQTTNLLRNGTYTISLTPGFTSGTFNEYFMAWIDYNQNGTFESPSERIYTSGAGVSTAVTGTFTVPATASFGPTRMRVTMKFYGVGDMTAPTACMNFNYGEVEDYCININGTNATDDVLNGAAVVYAVYPNPASASVLVDVYNYNEFADGKNTLTIFNAIGEAVSTVVINQKSTEIDLSGFSNGIYSYVLDLSGKAHRFGKIVVSK